AHAAGHHGPHGVAAHDVLFVDRAGVADLDNATGERARHGELGSADLRRASGERGPPQQPAGAVAAVPGERGADGQAGAGPAEESTSRDAAAAGGHVVTWV